MSRLTRTLSATSLAAVVSAALVAAPSSALAAKPAPPDTVDLVTGSMPEGISAGPRDTFFAGARSDGAVYVGNTRNGQLRNLVKGREGEVAVGLLYDAATSRLWVAGGATGDITAYDARSGRELFTANTGDDRFLNDVAITDDAVYVTDSTRGELIVVPTIGGALPADGEFDVLPLGAGYVQPSGFGANGIRVLPSGDLVLVSGGVLYAVDPTSGAVDVIEQEGRALTGGDGLVLDGSTLYVVYGLAGNQVVELRLADDEESTTFVRELTDPALDRPTTSALIGGALYVVNGRFSVAGNPLTENYVTRLDL